MVHTLSESLGMRHLRYKSLQDPLGIVRTMSVSRWSLTSKSNRRKDFKASQSYDAMGDSSQDHHTKFRGLRVKPTNCVPYSSVGV
ncbi:hypothetical protein PAXRUDRAFT_831580 [Paxillus rubicundulus Ve08.2h10]|uniref:Uncharacterized protein n=1 Tax=Paxillus rubicundulus Ve08.2h10 TaxID=930991 RepID=A0A0D0D253_9AGAM|nr:hypothetical protein PAXRUDRAFT_831580 [Paxillus rubicundulus Ve08.2h10]